MNSQKRIFISATCFAFALALSASGAQAQAGWPSKPVRFLVASAPGSAPDLLARTIADKLKDSLTQAVVVDNRGGVGGTIAHDALRKAPADGYTMLLTFTGALTFSPYLYKNVSYDPVTSFSPVTITARLPNVLLVSSALPVDSVAALVRLVKQSPGKYNYSSASNGTSSHLIMELFKYSAGLDITHVPFSSATAAMASILSGDSHIHFGLGTPALSGHLAAGKLKMLAVTSPTRYSLLPNVPTMVESGYPALDAMAWNGVLLPAGTPREIVDRLNREINVVMQLPDVVERLRKQGVEAAGGTPEAFAALIRAESEKWSAVIKRTGITLE